MPYVLGIDIGGTTTAAAVSRWRAGRWGTPEVVPLAARSASVPSVLHLTHDGEFTVGEPDAPDPGRVARGFARRVGDHVPMIIGGEPCPPEALTAVLAMWAVEQVAEREGQPADHVVLSHPASWGRHRRAVLHRALREIGLAEVTLLPEPVLAAESHVAAGWEAGTLAVYALGGTDHEAAVVRRRGHAAFRLLATAASAEPFGGADIDAALATHVQAALGAQLRELRRAGGAGRVALNGLRRDCRRAKERLATTTETEVVVPLPRGRTAVPVTRAELTELIRPAVQATVELLAETVAAAGLTADRLDGVLLTGGMAQLPLVAELVTAELPELPLGVAPDPQHTAAAGAAVAAGKIVTPVGRPGAGARPPEDPPAPVSPAPDGDDPPLPARRSGRAGAPPPRPPVEVTPLELPRGRSVLRRPGLVGGRS